MVDLSGSKVINLATVVAYAASVSKITHINRSVKMNIALWIAQGLLAAMFGMAGLFKATQTEKAREQMSWAKEASQGYILFIAISEILGAAGILLPMLTGILPWLTPLAAVGFAIIQILAIFAVHLPRKEFTVLPINSVLLALAIFVVIGRWSLFTL
jgi:uncharacterized membrane protein YphA (DoxX/SURF4 family)